MSSSVLDSFSCAFVGLAVHISQLLNQLLLTRAEKCRPLKQGNYVASSLTVRCSGVLGIVTLTVDCMFVMKSRTLSGLTDNVILLFPV